jgi:hypothetical protein
VTSVENLSTAIMVCKFIQKLNTSKNLDSSTPCAIRGSTTCEILEDIFLATTAPWKWRVKHAAKHLTTSNSLWPNMTQVHPIPVIRPQIAWLQDKHENLFTRRKTCPEELWFSRVNKSAYYKCFIILNQHRTEKKIVLHPNQLRQSCSSDDVTDIHL